MWKKQSDGVSLLFDSHIRKLTRHTVPVLWYPWGNCNILELDLEMCQSIGMTNRKNTVCTCGSKYIWFLEILLVKNWGNLPTYRLCILDQISVLPLSLPACSPTPKSRRIFLLCTVCYNIAQTQNYWSHCSTGIKALSEKSRGSHKDTSPFKGVPDERKWKNVISLPLPQLKQTTVIKLLAFSCKKLIRGGFEKEFEREEHAHRRCS